MFSRLTIVRSCGPLHQKSCKQTALSTLAVRNVITKQQRDLRVDLEIMVLGVRVAHFEDIKSVGLHIRLWGAQDIKKSVDKLKVSR